MKTSNIELNYLKKQIENQLRHYYLDKYIQKPVIAKDKLFILSSIIGGTDLPNVKKENYIITTMLVQIALDTHDLVSNQSNYNGASEKEKKQQLTVLAGNYYSGMYYYLLSRLDDIPMIYTLASAIKEINEQKMIIYYQKLDSSQDFMESLEKMESLLILSVADYLNQTSINSVIGNWLLTRKLMDEKSNYLEKGASPIFDQLANGFRSNREDLQAVPLVDNLIQKNIEKLEEKLFHLPVHCHSIKSYVVKMINDNKWIK